MHRLFPHGPAGMALAPFLVLLALVTACGGDSDRDPAGAGDASGALPLRIASVTLSRGVTETYEPVAATNSFPPDAAEVWAVVALENLSRPVKLTGAWSYLGPLGDSNPSMLAEASVDVEPVPGAALRSGLQLIKDGFDEGVYRLDVLVDGQPARSVQFAVVSWQAASTTPAAGTTPVALAATPEPPSPTATPEPDATEAPGTYTVQEGDTLSSIAEAHDTTIEALIAANNLPDADTLSLGQELVIP